MVTLAEAKHMTFISRLLAGCGPTSQAPPPVQWAEARTLIAADDDDATPVAFVCPVPPTGEAPQAHYYNRPNCRLDTDLTPPADSALTSGVAASWAAARLLGATGLAADRSTDKAWPGYPPASTPVAKRRARVAYFKRRNRLAELKPNRRPGRSAPPLDSAKTQTARQWAEVGPELIELAEIASRAVCRSTGVPWTDEIADNTLATAFVRWCDRRPRGGRDIRKRIHRCLYSSARTAALRSASTWRFEPVNRGAVLEELPAGADEPTSAERQALFDLESVPVLRRLLTISDPKRRAAAVALFSDPGATISDIQAELACRRSTALEARRMLALEPAVLALYLDRLIDSGKLDPAAPGAVGQAIGEALAAVCWGLGVDITGGPAREAEPADANSSDGEN